MKLREIYSLAIKLGIEKDVRGPQEIEKILLNRKQQFERMDDKDATFFDEESLNNPFSDSRILFGTGEEEIKTMMVGIDIEVPEILMADQLRQQGREIDMILAHHPEGVALAELYGVMDLQADLLARAGVPINVGENIMTARISEVKRNIMPVNHQRAVDAARILGIPFMCVHTPADNLVNDFVQSYLDAKTPERLEEVLDLLVEIPEYRQARIMKAGPQLVVGDKRQRDGRIMVDFTGATSGSTDVYEKLKFSGVGTVVCMHIQEKHREQAKKHNINVVVAGHIASDSLGLNLFLDQVESRGISIIPGSGLIRVSRL
ncbi:MAG: NGG1p interacting factor NIF3 [Syntrophomonadaceae bacterium]|nr:NGG1p interacting factor NIF3 [Syntrophomonadaceae bacterium]